MFLQTARCIKIAFLVQKFIQTVNRFLAQSPPENHTFEIPAPKQAYLGGTALAGQWQRTLQNVILVKNRIRPLIKVLVAIAPNV